MQPAAVMFLNGIDPIGTPYLAATDDLTRETWVAVGVRAARLVDGAS